MPFSRLITIGRLSLRPQTGLILEPPEPALTTTVDNPVPTSTHALIMGVATLVAAGLSWGVASALGGDAFTLRTVLIATGLGAIATAAPVLFRARAEYWGVVVLAAGVGRLLLSLGLCYVVRQNSPEVLARPLFVGVVSGAILLLIVEVVTAVKILSAIERRRHATLAGANTHGKAA